MARGLKVRELDERCRILEQTVRQRRLATPEELDAIRPGSAQNPTRDAQGALRHFGFLCGYLERADASEPQRRAADAALTAALMDLPKPITVVTRGPEGEPTPWKVYPKSFRVLLDCDIRDRIIQALTLRLESLRALPSERLTPDALQDMDYLARELSRQLGMLAWIATTPGPGFPYDEGADPEPDPPTAVADLDPWDLWQLAEGWHQVNASRLDLAEVLVAPTRGGSKDKPTRPSWAVLFSTVGVDLDIDPATLMRDRSLANVLATVRLGHPPAPEPKTSGPRPAAVGAEA